MYSVMGNRFAVCGSIPPQAVLALRAAKFIPLLSVCPIRTWIFFVPSICEFSAPFIRWTFQMLWNNQEKCWSCIREMLNCILVGVVFIIWSKTGLIVCLEAKKSASWKKLKRILKSKWLFQVERMSLCFGYHIRVHIPWLSFENQWVSNCALHCSLIHRMCLVCCPLGCSNQICCCFQQLTQLSNFALIAWWAFALKDGGKEVIKNLEGHMLSLQNDFCLYLKKNQNGS